MPQALSPSSAAAMRRAGLCCRPEQLQTHTPAAAPAQVLAWPAEVYCANSTVHALHALFEAMAAEEDAQAQQGGAQRVVVNPKALREALGAVPGRSFGVGERSSATLSALKRPCITRRSCWTRLHIMRTWLVPIPAVGEMNDAGEVLLTIYDEISRASPMVGG